jgi:hypothetical protein
MSLRVQLALEGNLAAFTKEVSAKLSFAIKVAAVSFATDLKLELRDDTRAGGLGDRVANAWQQKEYDNANGAPAVLVYSKAPLIETAFSADTTIVAKDGSHWLAIPTDNVPRIGNKRMSPVEVEARFDQDLIFKRSAPGTSLAFVDVLASRSGHGFRAQTKGRLAQGRKPQLVLMFVMVQQVRLRKRLDWPRIMSETPAKFEAYVGEKVNAALED